MRKYKFLCIAFCCIFTLSSTQIFASENIYKDNPEQYVITNTDETFSATDIENQPIFDEESLQGFLPEQEDNTNVVIEDIDSMLGTDEDGNTIKIEENANTQLDNETLDTIVNENESSLNNIAEIEDDLKKDDVDVTINHEIKEEIPDEYKINEEKEHNVEIKDTMVEELDQEIEQPTKDIQKTSTGSTTLLLVIIGFVVIFAIVIAVLVLKKNEK